MGGACALWQLRPPERKRFRAASLPPTAIRQIRAAGEPFQGTVPEETREKAKRDLEKAQKGGAKPTSRKRSQATLKALKREGRAAA
jgi:hypothetical protein